MKHARDLEGRSLKAISRARTTVMENWICRLALRFGPGLDTQNPDKHLLKKKEEYDVAKVDYTKWVNVHLRKAAKPLLDRAGAQKMFKTR